MPSIPMDVYWVLKAGRVAFMSQEINLIGLVSSKQVDKIEEEKQFAVIFISVEYSRVKLHPVQYFLLQCVHVSFISKNLLFFMILLDLLYRNPFLQISFF